MKSKPRRRRQVNKQALQDETKEAARKQFSGAALSFTTVLLFTSIFLNFRPVQQVRPTQNLGSVGLNFKTGQLGKKYVKATEIPFFI